MWIKNKFLLELKNKFVCKQRVTRDEAIRLYNMENIIELGMLGERDREKRYGRKAFYIYNQHINYTNVCCKMCSFCAFCRKKGDPDAFTYSVEDIRNIVIERLNEPIREIHIVGGINPDLNFNYYIDIIKAVREIRPSVTIKAFTAVEIDHIAKIGGDLSLEETFDILKEAGLDMLPGGGAEILSERIRLRLFPKKIDSFRWLEIHRAAHLRGIKTNATMLYGHIESIGERVDHLMKLRMLQDETNGFLSFVPLAFNSKNTKLKDIQPTSIFDDLKNIVVPRLFLDNFDHIKPYWVMIGQRVAQLALAFGADDLDGTIIDEKIAHMAGAEVPKGLSVQEMEKLILGADFYPFMRDSFYADIPWIERFPFQGYR